MEKTVAGDWETCIFPFRFESSVHLGLGKIAANKLEFSHDLPSCIDESVCAHECTHAQLSDWNQLSCTL